MSLLNSPSFFLDLSECEMIDGAKHSYRFKSFRLDVGERLLLKNGDPVILTPKAFDVLAALVERAGHLVEKDELLNVVWPDSFVEEANVARIVHTLRRSLEEDGNGNKFIETVAKKGYRFVAEVERIPEQVSEASAQAVKDRSIITEDPSRRTRFVIFAVCILSVIALFSLVAFNFRTDSSAGANEIRSIAILPVQSLTAENREPILELGIAQSIILELGAAKNLIVRPLSTTRQYTDARQDPIMAGREQKADYVFASNYQITDGKIRISSQLINVRSGQVEAVFKDEQILSGLLAVQDAVAANIGRLLLAKLNGQPNNLKAKRPTANEEAYRLYLTGTALSDKRTLKEAQKAVEYLEQAVRLDPNFALAYAHLATAQTAVGLHSGRNSEQYLHAKTAIEKALAIDENLSEAYTHLGELKACYEWDYDGAERAFKKAIELDPHSTVAHRIYAVYLTSMGRFDEALAEQKIAIDLEPASVLSQKVYGMTLYYARSYDEAIAFLLQSIEIDPNFESLYHWLVNSYKMKGEDDKAFEWYIRWLVVKKENVDQIPLFNDIYEKSGWRGINEWRIREALTKDGRPNYWDLAGLYAEIGEKEQSIVSLEKAFSVNDRGWGWTQIKINPRYDLIRSDPRFEAIVKNVGLK